MQRVFSIQVNETCSVSKETYSLSKQTYGNAYLGFVQRAFNPSEWCMHIRHSLCATHSHSYVQGVGVYRLASTLYRHSHSHTNVRARAFLANASTVIQSLNSYSILQQLFFPLPTGGFSFVIVSCVVFCMTQTTQKTVMKNTQEENGRKSHSSLRCIHAKR